MSVWVKICGIRDVVTAAAVSELGPQAIGLNFYAAGPRVVTPLVAAEIVSRLPAEIEPIGLFVNHSVDQIVDICQLTGLASIQLHGDEPPEMLAKLAAFRVIKAFRVGAAGLEEMAAYLERCQELGFLPAACLVDARVEGQYGGTGKKAPWELLGRDYQSQAWPPLILAGGLQPENVAEAIATVHPWGVDVAGGVESTVACKDIALVRKFIDNAQGASSG